MRLREILATSLEHVDELFPWDLDDKLASAQPPLLLDVREANEFDALHIAGSINVPRGILETACEYDYEETVPELVTAREREVVVICRSGNRSVLATETLQRMGYKKVLSLKTGIRGWNDYELALYDKHTQLVEIDNADEILITRIRPEQLTPK